LTEGLNTWRAQDVSSSKTAEHFNCRLVSTADMISGKKYCLLATQISGGKKNAGEK
jgi:hypothetical protein